MRKQKVESVSKRNQGTFLYYFLFGLCSLEIRLTTLPGGGAPLSWEELRSQGR